MSAAHGLALVPRIDEVPSYPAADPLPELVERVLASISVPTTRNTYHSVLKGFLQWRTPENKATHEPPLPLNKTTVLSYRKYLEEKKLSASTLNSHLMVLRRLAEEGVDSGVLDPMLAAGIAKVKGAKAKGTRMGNWLTQEQARKLLQAPGQETLKGRRDTALLALFFSCGLRRRELAELTFEHIQQRDGRWVIVDMVGKGGRIRTVTIAAEVKAILDCWVEAAGFNSGRVFRAINKGGRLDLDTKLSPQAVFATVVDYGGRSELLVRPHDLRRTFAKLTFKAGAPLEQIQISLGHASIQTTERYLGTQQDLTDAPGDRLKGLWKGLF